MVTDVSAVRDEIESGDGIVLVVADSEEYSETNTALLKMLTADLDLPGIYVTVNKPYSSLITDLEAGEVDTDRLFFIDAVSKGEGSETPEDAAVVYMTSPNHLTDISIAMSEAYSAMKDQAPLFLFFDSLSTLGVYHDPDTVSKFAHFLIGRLRTWDVTGIILSVPNEADEQIVDQLSQFCDATVHL